MLEDILLKLQNKKSYQLQDHDTWILRKGIISTLPKWGFVFHFYTKICRSYNFYTPQYVEQISWEYIYKIATKKYFIFMLEKDSK